MTGKAVRETISNEDLLNLRGDLESGGGERSMNLIIGSLAEKLGEDNWRLMVDSAPDISKRALSIFERGIGREKSIATSRERELILRSDLFRGGWLESSVAAAHISGDRHWSDPSVLGSASEYFGELSEDDHERMIDAEMLSNAIAVAVRETISNGALDHHDTLQETAYLTDDSFVLDAEDQSRAIDQLLNEFYINGRISGYGHDLAKAKALIAAASLRGQALERSSGLESNTVMALGAAARTLLCRKDDNDSLNDMDERLLGAAALGVTFGFTHGWQSLPKNNRTVSLDSAEPLKAHDEYDGDQEVLLMVDGVLPLRFSNDFLKRIGIMTPQGGRALLYRLINNPKVSETEKEKYSLLWDVLEGASRGKRTASTSLARLLNIRENHAVDSTIVQDELVFDAAPVGKYPPVIECTGKMGRKFKCRAVANQRGELVGYRAYDPLSDEFYGSPTHALFDTEGRLVAILEDDEGGYRVKLGEPERRLITLTDPWKQSV